MDKIKVGSTIWVFDINHREYSKPADSSKIWGELIWKAHWRAEKITGETSRSWLIRHDRVKVNKKDPGRAVCFTEREVDERVWVHQHAHRIGQLTGSFKEYAVLHVIAGMVGYDPEKWGKG